MCACEVNQSRYSRNEEKVNVIVGERKGVLYIYNSTCTRSVPANDEKSTSAASLIYTRRATTPFSRTRSAS